MPSEHLTEETIAELAEGRLAGTRFESAERHVSECERCMRLLDEAGRALASGSQAPSTKRVPAPLAAGAHVGRYEIVEPVGAGGMGRVYAARDPMLDRRVALKLLHPHAASDELEIRLLREAKAMARLSHPEVITVHDAGRYGDQLFIAMEFVEGCTLRQWLARTKRPWREVLSVFLRAGRGLLRAHEAGIVHRDFKPDNVLVGDDGRVRVTDFGLARAVQTPDSPPPEGPLASPQDDTAEVPLTRTGVLLGTPAYMAPEQHAGASADERSDIYAFCVALYEGLYGERPFPGPTLLALVQQKRAGNVPVPKDERGVPRRLYRAIVTGLRPQPVDRHASMADLLATLERSARTPRSWIAPALVTAVVLAAGAAFATRGFAPAAPPRPSASGIAAAMPPRECATQADCAKTHPGEPQACRASDGKCVPIASEDCKPMFEPGDAESADTVWLGAMFPLGGPPFGKMNLDGVDMARQEFAHETRALTGQASALHTRRIAVVACDDSHDPRRAATHLVDDVGVPAILGFGSGRALEDLAGSLLVPRRVLSVATLTNSPFVTQVPQPPDVPRLEWRTSYSVEAVAVATAAFARDSLIPYLHRAKARVTLLRDPASSLLPFAQRLYRELFSSGSPVLESTEAYQELEFARPDAGDDLQRVARAVSQHRPSIVITVGDADEPVAAVRAIEALWPPGEPRPTYVLADDSTDTLAAFSRLGDDRRRRVFAVSSALVPTSTDHFVLRFNLAHPGEATESLNPSASYDAFYLLAYAVVAQKDRAVSGPSLGLAIPRLLPPGRPVETGPSDVLTAIAALSRGENIDLGGPSGSLNLDAATGEWSPDFILTCPVATASGRVSDVESGAAYSAASHAIEGGIRCR